MVVRLHRAYCRPCELFSTESPPFRVVSKYKIERCQMSQVQTAHAQLKTPWPLTGHTQSQGLMRPAPRRQSQTGLGHPARTPTDCDTCGFGEGVVGSDRHSGGQPLRTPSAAPALGRAPWVGVHPPMHTDLPGKRKKAEPAFQSAESELPVQGRSISGSCTVLDLW